METQNSSNTTLQGGVSFKVENIKKILANLVRVKWFYEKFGPTFEPCYFATVDPMAPHEIMEQIFIEAQGHFKKFGTLITQDILKHEIDLFFEQFKKDKKQLPDWYALVDEIFGYQDEDLKTEYYAEWMASVAQTQEMKLAYHKAILEDLPKVGPHVAVDKAIDDLIRISKLSEPIEIATLESLPLVFPKDAIQGFIKDFADLYASYLEAPYEFWLFNMATCLGNIFSTRATLKNSLFTQPRLFTILLGLSGDSRKSSSGRLTIDFLNEISPVDSENKKSELFKSLWGCGSSEGLLRKFEVTPNLVLVYDELRAFVQKSNLKGANLLQVVNGLFDRNQEENAVKDKKDCIQVDNAYLSLLGFCTTDTWETLFTSAFLDIGFINRLWIVPGEAEKKEFNPEFIPTSKKRKLKATFQCLLESFPVKPLTIIPITDKADVELNYWYHSYENTEFTRRLDDYGRRLLLIMAISENKKEIAEDMAKRVISLLDWEKQVREMYQPGIYSSTMSQIENLLRKAVKKHQPVTEGVLLHKIHSDRFDTWHVQHALEGLVKNGEFRKVFKGRFPAYILGNKKNE